MNKLISFIIVSSRTCDFCHTNTEGRGSTSKIAKRISLENMKRHIDSQHSLQEQFEHTKKLVDGEMGWNQ